MRGSNHLLISPVFLFLVFIFTSVASADERTKQPLVEQYLTTGKLDQGHKVLSKHLAKNPDDSQARFGLGALEFLRAVETFAQSLHKHGLKTDVPQVPFVRLSVPPNRNPKKITYKKFRSFFQRLIRDLEQADKTLAQVEDDNVKLKLPIGLIRLDLDGDGKASENETFWRIFTSVALRAAKIDFDERRMAFPIAFDRADVHWMHGYSHLIRGMAEAYLAYDAEGFFNNTAHVFFRGAETPYTRLLYKKKESDPSPLDEHHIADMVAAIHLTNFEVIEPKRLQKAHQHLLAMVNQSRQCWKYAVQEKDNDREWIPNANQTSLVPGMDVDQEIIREWKHFLNEFEAILEGEKLIPHWRFKKSHGINLKKVFYQARRFDLVMWAHGAAALPYLEQGKRTDPETWARLQRTFRGNFLAFAVWFQ